MVMDRENRRRDGFVTKRLQACGLDLGIIQRGAECMAEEDFREPLDQCDSAGSGCVNFVSDQFERRLEPRKSPVVIAPNVDHPRKRSENGVLRVSFDGECAADEMRASAASARSKAQIGRDRGPIEKVFEPKGRAPQVIAQPVRWPVWEYRDVPAAEANWRQFVDDLEPALALGDDVEGGPAVGVNAEAPRRTELSAAEETARDSEVAEQ
jgi:hypothetical protein